MRRFEGFPPGRASYTPIPDQFFSELLASIDDLAEMKLLLYLFWALYHQKGSPRYMTMAELENEGILLSGLPTKANQTPVQALQDAVNRAIARGTVLRLDVSNDQGVTSYLFINTHQGRKAVKDVQNGTLILESRGRVVEAHIAQDRPSIFALYEENIGLLTPLIREELIEAAHEYPERWIEEAFKIAVERNARNWRYISAILKRWAAEGRQ